MTVPSFSSGTVAGRAFITDASQTGLDILGDFTLEFWLRSNADGEQDIVLKRHSAGALFAYNAFKLNQVDLRVQVADATPNISEVGFSGAFTDDGTTWEHFAITCDISQPDASKFELFKNGDSQGNGTVITAGNPVAIVNGDGDFVLGGDLLHSGGLKAELFDVRLWSDIRTPTEISGNYLSVFRDPDLEANLVGNWFIGGAHFQDRSAGATGRNDLDVNDVTQIPFLSVLPTGVLGPVGQSAGKLLEGGPLSDEVYPTDELFAGQSGSLFSIEGGPLADEIHPEEFVFRGQSGTLEGEAAGFTDGTPPVITNFSPPVGASINSSDILSFDITDNNGSFARIILHASIEGIEGSEVVHDGMSFNQRLYSGSVNTRTVITDGFSYTIRRDTGWTGAVTLIPFAIDAVGNENT